MKDGDLTEEFDFGRVATTNPDELKNKVQSIGSQMEDSQNKNTFDPGHEHLFLPRGKMMIRSNFESVDGWTAGGVGTPVLTPYIGGVKLATSNAANDTSFIKASNPDFNTFDPTKSSAFQTIVKVDSATNITAYFGAGDFGSSGYGFKLVNATLSGFATVGASEALLTLSVTATYTDFNEFRATFDGIVVRFFVNGNKVGAMRNNIPTATDPAAATFYVKTGTTAVKTMYSKYMFFVQQT